MIRHRFSILLVVGVFALTLACGKQPALDVQQQGEAAPAPQAPAPETAAETPELISSRAPAAGELPAGHPPLDAAAGALELAPVAAEAGQGATALAWTAPAGWVSEPPANTMRRAQYRVPGPGGEGECVVFYFGPGQGGDPLSNAQRWASQFTLADGSSGESALKTSEMKVGDVAVLLAEVAGTYNAGMSMGMAPSEPQPGYKLLGAVAEGADANWFFKFTGPEKTVDANRAAFEGMLKSIRRGA